MDLHRPFKMDSPSYLPAPLASPALMVLASTAEAGRDASVPCQAPRPFGVPTSVEKDLHLPFPSASYTFTSMYQRQGPMSGTFPSRDFPASLLHLHPQFTPPNLDCSTLGMLNHSGVGAFRPFSSTQEERDSGGYQSAFTPAKRLKSCFPEVEGKEFDFSSPGGSLKAGEDTGRKLFSMSGLLSDGEASSSPEERKEHSKMRGLYDTQTPVCPVCQAILRPGELQDHMEQEMSKLAQLQISGATITQHDHLIRTPKSLSLSLNIKCEGGSPTSPPRPVEDTHSDRYQTFLRVRANRHTRLNVDDLCWCRCYVKSAPLRPHSAGAHLDCTQAVRISKLKRRKPEDGQEASADLVLPDDDWNHRRRIQMTSLVGGFKGAVLVSTTTKECRDSDADLDVDGDDTLEYGRAQYSETDVIPCSGESSKDTTANSSMLELSKWSSEGSPSTSSGEKMDSSIACLPKTCKNTEIEALSEDSTLTTLDALKARIRDLEKQLSKGDRFKCLICMDTYTTPLTSIQCWHVHCEECWLRTLGAKKLCPQCNTITSPGDLRRVYL
ncbi:E3 ubiquitin-protein ligase RNF220 isoform X2 [Sphaeramia orbicularis]|uniref:E3 ubiquitin-protein ligase RNF220 isoform X2 n=1 Tax=Sphaeramia orbicularis TaxID=375764 RepID=UPI0011815C37|nr:E3 ubiquitin-protein ligase RNF220-like isoform X2 [Sphaeramia orbicularis]